jgi:hypothetical protein
MRSVGWLLIAACSAGEATAPPPQAPTPAGKSAGPESIGLNPGESMAFEVRLAGLLAGEAQLAVGPLGEYAGHRAVVVKSRAESAGAAALIRHVVDEATTVVDMDSGRPLALETLVEQGDARTTATATFTPGLATITYARTGESAPHQLRINVGGRTLHDAHSAMAELRGWRAARGAKRSVFVVGGRRLWRVDISVAGEEAIGSAIGNRRAIHFTGISYRANRNLAIETSAPRRFSVWLSDDADRVPLRLIASTELGDIAMDLTEYSR